MIKNLIQAIKERKYLRYVLIFIVVVGINVYTMFFAEKKYTYQLQPPKSVAQESSDETESIITASTTSSEGKAEFKFSIGWGNLVVLILLLSGLGYCKYKAAKTPEQKESLK